MNSITLPNPIIFIQIKFRLSVSFRYNSFFQSVLLLSEKYIYILLHKSNKVIEIYTFIKKILGTVHRNLLH